MPRTDWLSEWKRGARRSEPTASARRSQRYQATDRQCRGALLALCRTAAPAAVPRSALDAAWPDPVQRDRALAGLIEDGLIVMAKRGRYGLPGMPTDR